MVAIITVGGTVAVGLIGAILGRRWGLPGLGREVQTQQAALISTMQAELTELRAQQVQDEAKIKRLEVTVSQQSEALEKAERKINRQQAELIDLYRLTGKQVPSAW